MGSESEELDRLLQAAMERYSPEPRAGIEQRVLRGVRAHGYRRRIWVLAFAASMALVLLAVVLVWKQPARPVEPVLVQVVPSVTSAVLTEVRATYVQRGIRRSRVRVKPFPTPTPLTDEERALQEFVMTRPAETRELLARKTERPIEIDELNIPPLEKGGS